MPADLSVSDGRVEMAFEGSELPWHGLGQPVDRAISTQGMLKAAHLDWSVELGQVQFTHPRLGLITDADHRVMSRGDTGKVLDVVGKGYQPFQNTEVLDFFRQYVEAGDMTINTAGALNGGKQIWALAKLGQDFTLPGKDKVEGYVLLMNPHQYGKGGILKFTPIRVVCSNTLAMAMQGGEGIRLWHNRPFDEEMQESAKQRLGIAREMMASFKDSAKSLASWALDEPQALQVLTPLGANQEKPKEEQTPTVHRLLELWQGAGMGANMKAAQGTAWGLLNAVTQYYDHEYGRSRDARLTNAWLGKGAVVKKQVLNNLLQLGQAA